MVDDKKIAPHVTLRKELRQFWRKYKTPRSGITKDKKRMYRSRNTDCAACALKDQCCPKSPFKRVGRSIYEHARDEVRRLRKTPEYEQSKHDRKKVEMAFAHLKRILGFRRRSKPKKTYPIRPKTIKPIAYEPRLNTETENNDTKAATNNDADTQKA